MITRRTFLQYCFSTVAGLGLSQLLERPAFAAVEDVPVLLYHRVGYTPGELTVSPERFAADLRDLKDNGYKTISLKQFLRFLEGPEAGLPAHPVVITFDDGYLDNYEYAFPILAKFGMIAGFFLISGLMGEPERMTPSQVLEMAHYGMSFGSHTVSHRALGNLPETEMRSELAISRQVLGDLLGKSIDFVAYPRGSYTAGTLELAREVGYTGGFTVRYGSCGHDSPSFTLSRIPVFKSDPGIMTVIDRRG